MIKNGESFQKVNLDLIPLQGSMILLSCPGRPWSMSGVDAIIKLSSFPDFFLIMVGFNHYSKGAHLIPAGHTWSASQLAGVCVKEVFRFHRFRETFVSNRGTMFVGVFWKPVCK